MTTPAPVARRRPRTVTAAVLVLGLVLVVDVVLGVALLLAARDEDLLAEVALDAAPVILSAAVVLAIAAVLAMLMVGLLRGANSARLVVSLVLLVRLAYDLYLGDAATAGTAPIAIVVVATLLLLGLLWNRAASEYFERPEERALVDALTGASDDNSGRRRVRQAVGDYVLRLLVLGATIALTPGIRVQDWWALPLATLAVWLTGALLQPVLVRLAGLFGWWGSLLLALFANAAVIGAGLRLTPGIDVDGIAVTVLASWLYALAMTLITWVFSINSQDYLLVHAARMSLRQRPARDLPEPGVLFVQLDGVPAPVLEYEVKAGNLPTISRWIRDGTHTWTEWVARVPSTTPVSQAGLLHGTNDDIPAFRWYEKERGALVVSNHPPDATLIESRLSDGRGLLADGGVSISNLFSGDAPTSLLTMSGLRRPGGGLGPSQSYASFFTHPAGFLRSVLLTLGEMGKEVWQARRQERRDIRPRIRRHGSYVALRGVTNVFLRDLNVALIVEAMMSGAKSIYVDFVDYDEVAHHAGVTRSESMDSLYGLDQVLGGLERLARSGATPRTFHIVLLSDHGQSQGATFSQRAGQSLEDLVRGLMNADERGASATDEVEAWGPVNVFLNQLSAQDSVSGRITKRALAERDGGSALGPTRADHDAAGGTTQAERPPLVVVGSGNLGGIWFPRLPGRLLLSEIEAVYPGLVQALADNDSIGFVVVMTQQGPLAIGSHGTHLLTDGTVTGEDPLCGYGPDARADFLRAAQFPHAPDLYLNSVYDPVLDEVAAFEELVGCHGGLGGWQTRPILVYPSEWTVDDDLLDERGRLYGADVVHRQLVRWLERLGHRQSLEPRLKAGTAANLGA